MLLIFMLFLCSDLFIIVLFVMCRVWFLFMFGVRKLCGFMLSSMLLSCLLLWLKFMKVWVKVVVFLLFCCRVLICFGFRKDWLSMLLVFLVVMKDCVGVLSSSEVLFCERLCVRLVSIKIIKVMRVMMLLISRECNF